MSTWRASGWWEYPARIPDSRPASPPGFLQRLPGRGELDVLSSPRHRVGGLDFAVNNAGMASHHRQLDQMTLDEFARVIHVNLAGTFLCMKYELPLLKGGGAIINIASNGGLSVIPHAPAYVAATQVHPERSKQ